MPTVNDYTPDQKFITFQHRGSEIDKVPVSLLDEISERGLWSYDLESLLWFRSVTRGATKSEWLTMKELVGQDLTDKTIHFWHANYEDSEWRSVVGPLSAKKVGDHSVQLVFPEDVERWWNDMGNEPEPSESWRYDEGLGHNFYPDETVLVVTGEPEVSDGAE